MKPPKIKVSSSILVCFKMHKYYQTIQERQSSQVYFVTKHKFSEYVFLIRVIVAAFLSEILSFDAVTHS